ncbi:MULTISPECIES: DUF4422 domain-containing protein [unclassified Bifidobacterium]|uniref:DUF4422 domain-containing protein n=1 Tax=unclassified Bifidobacterium TaxID=2608897 RepID=UPI0023F7C23F|nr:MULTISPECIES: DUF4422 domain-containing protein [unclassified Bifidobacterium]WEV65980.1 DUF4422 domain-containing protein [Bifidobacterium sp. ESL0764]WEV75231.1 DUF4422 domain-containing protein [Bifidobacterium sp. ESL0800]
MDSKAQENQPRIRIFISSHKHVNAPQGECMQLVQVGAAHAPEHFEEMAHHDDEGENISEKNPMYCELTTQYWAWKNVDADYYGFCHYRRYFDFSDVKHEENAYGEVMDSYIDQAALNKYGINDETIQRIVPGYDVITTPFGDLRRIIDQHKTPTAVWHAATQLHDDDLKRMRDIIGKLQPEYLKDADTFLNGNSSCFCNMFIMKKEIFFDYCEWIFPILEEFERETDMSKYSKEALRTPGHLAERLLNIYLLHHKRVGTDWKMKELQCVHFTHPEPDQPLAPIAEVGKPLVPVVFAANEKYVPQLATAIYSAMSNASKDRHYDVVVLQRDITPISQRRMQMFFERFENMTLRFVDVDREISRYHLSTNNPHISIETYYRFVIQGILPFYDKVLYLDADIIVTGDIAELYDTEIGDNLLAAAHDIDFLSNLNVKNGKRPQYATETLKMHDPYAYFQAGVLILNTKAMRQYHSVEQWLTLATNPDYIYNDQDVLNVQCEGRMTYLPWQWNVLHDCAGRVSELFVSAPNNAYDAYMQSRKDPKIIHYAGFIKPWNDPDCDFAYLYWEYARETPFYEQLIKKVVVSDRPKTRKKKSGKPRAVKKNSGLRRILDPILPIGSKRREFFKVIGRVIRH